MSKEIVSSQKTPPKESTCLSSVFGSSFFDWPCNAHAWLNIHSPFSFLSLGAPPEGHCQSLWLSLEIKAEGSIATCPNQLLKE